VLEARKLKIPIVAIVDTNCDPDQIDYIVPGNDDAIRAIKLICGQMVQAVTEGLMAKVESEAPAPAEEVAPGEGEKPDQDNKYTDLPMEAKIEEPIAPKQPPPSSITAPDEKPTSEQV